MSKGVDTDIVDFEKILRVRGISKQELAAKLGIPPQHVARTLKRFSKNLSEIDNVLQLLGTSLRKESSGDEPISAGDSQQRTIENLSETIKNLTSK